MSWQEFQHRRFEKRLEKGYRALEEGDLEAALEIAGELEPTRLPEAFELAARAHELAEDPAAALEVLERGAEVAPDAWAIWQMLGIYRSDRGELDPAAEAFEKALTCDECWRDLVLLNQAILAQRREDPERALRLVEQVEDEELADQRASLEIDAKIDLGQLDAAETLARQIIDSVEVDDPDAEDFDLEDYERVASAWIALARISLARGQPEADAREYLLQAYQIDPGNSDVLWYLREIDNELSASAKYYRLVLRGIFGAGDPFYQDAQGFWAKYDVVSDTVEEALRYIRRVERARPCRFLEVDECEILETAEDQPKGVYQVSVWALFDER